MDFKKIAEWPIILPLLLLLKSEKFLIVLITLIADYCIAVLPQLEPVRGEMLLIFSVIGTTLIAGTFFEHLVKDKPDLTPLFGPIVRLLKSRKVMIALLTLAIDILVAYFPALEKVRAELLTVMTVLGGTLISMIAYEDRTKAAKPTVKPPETSTRQFPTETLTPEAGVQEVMHFEPGALEAADVPKAGMKSGTS